MYCCSHSLYDNEDFGSNIDHEAVTTMMTPMLACMVETEIGEQEKF